MLDPREDTAVEGSVRTDLPVVRRSQRVLTAEDLAERRAEERENGELELQARSVEEVPSAPREAVDPEAALRHARLGFVAVAVLVLWLVWMMQRRKGA